MFKALNRQTTLFLLTGILFMAAELFPSVQLCSMGFGCVMPPVQISCCNKQSSGKTISSETQSCCATITISKLETEKVVSESSVLPFLSVSSTELLVLPPVLLSGQTLVSVLPGSPPPVYLSCKVFLI